MSSRGAHSSGLSRVPQMVLKIPLNETIGASNVHVNAACTKLLSTKQTGVAIHLPGLIPTPCTPTPP